MQKLHFAKDDGLAFYKELSAEIKQYFEKHQLKPSGGKKMVVKLCVYLGTAIALYVAALLSPATPLFYLIYVLTGITLLLLAFNVAHDAAHGVAMNTKKGNARIFQLSFALLGNNAYVWGRHHNESHHLYTNVEGSDIDVLHHPLFRMTETQTLRWFHKYQHLYSPLLYMFYSLNWFLMRDTVALFNYSSRTIDVRIPPKEVVKLILFKLGYVAYMIVLPGLLTSFGWKHVLFAFLLNHALLSLFFVAVLGVAHVSDYVKHPLADAEGKMNMSWPTMQFSTSVDFNSDSRFLNWTLGGFNAHTLHHLLPNVCHVHYVNLLPIFRRLANKHRMIYMEMPYSRAIGAHFRCLYKMGRDHQMQNKVYESFS